MVDGMTATGGGDMPVSDQIRLAIGSQKMLALQRAIYQTRLATVETRTSLCRHHGLEVNTDDVVADAGHATVVIRALDSEVLKPEAGYERYRDGDPDGRVVSGLTLIRNHEAHPQTVLAYDTSAVISLLLGDPPKAHYQIFPVWNRHDALPPEIRDNPKTAKGRHAHYASDVGGRPVLDTLLDALRFFVRCDPRLAARDGSGELRYFPLPPLIYQGSERLHPMEASTSVPPP